jgi:hypothetical protein
MALMTTYASGHCSGNHHPRSVLECRHLSAWTRHRALCLRYQLILVSVHKEYACDVSMENSRATSPRFVIIGMLVIVRAHPLVLGARA